MSVPGISFASDPEINSRNAGIYFLKYTCFQYLGFDLMRNFHGGEIIKARPELFGRYRWGIVPKSMLNLVTACRSSCRTMFGSAIVA